MGLEDRNGYWEGGWSTIDSEQKVCSGSILISLLFLSFWYNQGQNCKIQEVVVFDIKENITLTVKDQY